MATSSWVFDMQPMSAAIDDLYAGLGEAGADGAEELPRDECVSAAANYENRAGVLD